jgi:hypothetical protein
MIGDGRKVPQAMPIAVGGVLIAIVMQSWLSEWAKHCQEWCWTLDGWLALPADHHHEPSIGR